MGIGGSTLAPKPFLESREAYNLRPRSISSSQFDQIPSFQERLLGCFALVSRRVGLLDSQPQARLGAATRFYPPRPRLIHPGDCP